MGKYKRWTKERKEEARALYLAGHSIAEVAQRVESSNRHVAKALRELGVPKHPRSAYRDKYIAAARTRSRPKRKVWTPERDAVVAKMHSQGMLQREIAEHFGSTAHQVGFSLRRSGIETNIRTGRRNPAWKGGRNKDADGYIHLLQPDHPGANHRGYVLEHRLVVEETLGRFLAPGEVVHHRNGVRDDNHPDNLQLFPSNGEHLRQELSGKVPSWSAEGKALLAEGVRRSAERRSKKSRSKTGAPEQQ